MRFIGTPQLSLSLSASASQLFICLALSDGEGFKVKLPENDTRNSLGKTVSILSSQLYRTSSSQVGCFFVQGFSLVFAGKIASSLRLTLQQTAYWLLFFDFKENFENIFRSIWTWVNETSEGVHSTAVGSESSAFVYAFYLQPFEWRNHSCFCSFRCWNSTRKQKVITEARHLFASTDSKIIPLFCRLSVDSEWSLFFKTFMGRSKHNYFWITFWFW